MHSTTGMVISRWAYDLNKKEIENQKKNSENWGGVCFSENGYWKTLSKLSCVCLPLKKLVNGKHFPVKEKFGLISRKVFSFYFEGKTLSGSCEKFKNIILFADYIKFDSQTFDIYIYIYFLFWIFVF